MIFSLCDVAAPTTGEIPTIGQNFRVHEPASQLKLEKTLLSQNMKSFNISKECTTSIGQV